MDPSCRPDRERFPLPPSPVRETIAGSFMPRTYGDAYRQAVKGMYPSVATETIDAVELQRHLLPSIDTIVSELSVASPEVVAKELKPTSLYDLRTGIQEYMIDRAAELYDKIDQPSRSYHTAVATRYLKNHEGLQTNDRATPAALRRLNDGIATGTRTPFMLFAALPTYLEKQGIEPTAENVAKSAEQSWQFIHSLASLDLASFEFIEGQLFWKDESRGLADDSWRINVSNKWSRLMQVDPETLAVKLDLTQKSQERHQVALSAHEAKQLQSIVTTGSERLRCPMTHLSTDTMRAYVKFLAKTTHAAGLFDKL